MYELRDTSLPTTRQPILAFALSRDVAQDRKIVQYQKNLHHKSHQHVSRFQWYWWRQTQAKKASPPLKAIRDRRVTQNFKQGRWQFSHHIAYELKTEQRRLRECILLCRLARPLVLELSAVTNHAYVRELVSLSSNSKQCGSPRWYGLIVGRERGILLASISNSRLYNVQQYFINSWKEGQLQTSQCLFLCCFEMRWHNTRDLFQERRLWYVHTKLKTL